MTFGPAMSYDQAEQAILTGIDLVRQQKKAGMHLLATGEMGIGNTTTATAVSCVLLGVSPQELTGRGAGLSDQGLLRKRQAIEKAIACNRPDAKDPVDILSKVGGFDIAGLCGVFLGRVNLPDSRSDRRRHQRGCGAVRGTAGAFGVLRHFCNAPECRTGRQVAAGGFGQTSDPYGRHAAGGREPVLWPSCLCWIWRWPSTTAVRLMITACSRIRHREVPDADPGDRRFRQRQK